MSPTPDRLVGREDELGAVIGRLEGRDGLAAVVVLVGDAGIGKTTLWLAGTEAAAAGGCRILSTRPLETETKLSYVGLADLLGDVEGEVLAALPPVQREALEAALLRGESAAHVDERAVASGFLGALRLLANEAPVCLAVDDVQWLDAASFAALGHALARLDHEPVAAVLAARGDLPSWLRRAVAGPRLQTIQVVGLSIGAINELLHARLDVMFPRPTLIRIWEASRGNPFFALELASALQRRGGTLAPGEELPIPSDLGDLLEGRIDGLGPAALEVARTVTALAEPTVSVVEAAVGKKSFDDGLTETLAAHILELDRDRLRFTHPLLGSAVAGRATPSRRRALHARLAKVASTGEERARHLALATEKPSRKVAGTLEEAARAAQARGAQVAAAELAEQALRLTPDADVEDAERRLSLAADRYYIAGDTERAIGLLERARASATTPFARAAILVQLGETLYAAAPRESEALFAEALIDACGNDALEAAIHVRRSDVMRWGAGIDEGLAHATLAVEAASRTDDAAATCSALAVQADWRFRAGGGIQHSQMDEALALERSLPAWPLSGGPFEHYCHQLLWATDLDLARPLLLELRDIRAQANDPQNEAWALWNMGLLEWRAGNWDEADRYVAEFVDLKAQLGGITHTGEFPAAIIAAHRGRIEEARALAHQAIARGGAAGVQIERSGHAWVLGFIELSLSQPSTAVDHLRTAYEIRNAFMLEPAQRLELGDLLEALISLGELDEAEQTIAAWEPRASTLDRAWALAILSRCRGLLGAARGDLEAAFAHFEHALTEHKRTTDSFQHARTLLALGRTQRRAKRRGAARATLEDARAAFEQLGAPMWAEQARSELARIGGRAPSRGELTEAERRIAGLVAEGRTNREVAAALYLTEHSVETSLTRVYRKLGVRSRAELAHLIAATSTNS